ncbi:MAG: glycosyl transferase [Bacteroidetes bacterium SW_11_45_7]|nr:MAG: glycosyl transferase [Bacteroidetes bacterium SW_11_45_7]
MELSIIIPTYNEEDNIGPLVRHLWHHGANEVHEVVVVDGDSADQTVNEAEQADAMVLQPGVKSRARQMNEGAKATSGNILYFVHADARPPSTYVTDIQQAIEKGYPHGCFRFRFDRYRGMLKVNSFFTRFDKTITRGGDQTLFITRQLFDQVGGFRDDYIIMEDFEFIMRSQKAAPFTIIPRDVIVSARKYEDNSWLRVNLANLIVYSLFHLGVSQHRLLSTYKSLIKHPKF